MFILSVSDPTAPRLRALANVCRVDLTQVTTKQFQPLQYESARAFAVGVEAKAKDAIAKAEASKTALARIEIMFGSKAARPSGARIEDPASLRRQTTHLTLSECECCTAAIWKILRV